MKPHYHKVPIHLQSSFSIRHDVQANFGNIWHYHPELELHYVIKGEGVRLIGDHVSHFSAGELLLLGENLPHTWHCQEDYFVDNAKNYVEAIVLHFRPSCLGGDFLGLPEARALLKLFERAKRGMKIFGSTKNRLINLMQQTVEAQELSKIILLLQILETLANTNDYDPISDAVMALKHNEGEMARMNKIYNYTLTNYDKTITLKDIASISNLTATSFCRYFKLMTDKTYADFLTEVRINNACKLLTENVMQIEEICYACGFNNLSNFYRHFKRLKKRTPKEFRSCYRLI